ncbi:SAG-related sequence [Besnoitia besnoiti]|uniref:SAG-related sequence n=1 Tax=Besnoitia besnoiti TaxID=94643 RepID=A0A2A9M934_BESBE|nr:SAG-related sequence [Besnoitia besnoiti]PFH33704.1 SAG-related sequence [Besnoitia besnoiti]
MLSTLIFIVAVHLVPTLFVSGATGTGSSHTCSAASTAISVAVNPQTKEVIFVCEQAVPYVWPAGDAVVTTFFSKGDLKDTEKLADVFGAGSQLTVQASDKEKKPGAPVTATLTIKQFAETPRTIYFACGTTESPAKQATSRRLSGDEEGAGERGSNLNLQGKEHPTNGKENQEGGGAPKGENKAAAELSGKETKAASPSVPRPAPSSPAQSVPSTKQPGNVAEGEKDHLEDQHSGSPPQAGATAGQLGGREGHLNGVPDHKNDLAQPQTPPRASLPTESTGNQQNGPPASTPSDSLSSTSCLVTVTVPGGPSATACTADKKTMELDINRKTKSVTFECGSTVPSLSPADSSLNVYDGSCNKKVSLLDVLPTAKLETADSGYTFSVERLPSTPIALCYKCLPTQSAAGKEAEMSECTIKISVAGEQPSSAAGGSLRFASFSVFLSLTGLCYLY